MGGLPYGIYICDDGREVLFGRGYEPLWSRTGGAAAQADPKEFIKFKEQKWFWQGRDIDKKATRERLNQVLRDFVSGKPVNRYFL